MADLEGWDLQPGDLTTRKERADLYGGATQGGIQPSNQSPNIFIYTDPAKGLAHGYDFDGWNPDGTVFFYTGEGQSADQVLTKGNAAILAHADRRRVLRLFSADGVIEGTGTKRQRYIGAFEIDPDRPLEWETSIGGDGELRKVVVFRLLPIGRYLRRPREFSKNPISPLLVRETLAPLDGDIEHIVETVMQERASTPFFVHHDVERLRTSVRREADLTQRLTRHLESKGHTVARNRITPAGSAFALYTDVYDETDNVVYEAKSRADRVHVRLAVGQLLDYRRYLDDDVSMSGLFPNRPLGDLPGLLTFARLGLSYDTATGFDLLTA